MEDFDGVTARSPFDAVEVGIERFKQQIADFGEKAQHEAAGEAGIALNVSPGVYRARVQTGPLGEYEIFVTAPKGWQSRLFLECEDFYWYGEPFRRPSLRSSSILMARIGEPFDPGVTVEGLYTARRIAADNVPDTPITDVVAAMADGRLDFAAALDTLLARPLKPE